MTELDVSQASVGNPLFVEEFFSDSVVSVFANGRAYIGAVSISCISIVGHFEVSKKSNSVRTAWPKSTKL